MPDLSLVFQKPAEQAQQLILLCHAAGADAASMMPLGVRLCDAFPQATIVSLQADSPAATPKGFDWFSTAEVPDDNRVQSVAPALVALQAAVLDWQQRSAVSASATALIGLGQGGEMALEASKLEPMLASRVVAIGGRFTTLPDTPPAVTTIHFLHGKQDAQTHYGHSVTAAHHLKDMGCDITAEVVPFVDHALHPDLVELAITKLSTHIAQHMWTSAQQDAPPTSSIH